MPPSTSKKLRPGFLERKFKRKLPHYPEQERAALKSIFQAAEEAGADWEKEGFRLLRELWPDEDEWIQKQCWIQTKMGGGLQLLRYNPIQQKLLHHIRRLQEGKRPVRLIILKARQMGCSTFIQSKFFAGAALNSGVDCFTLGNKKKTTKNMMKMVLRFYRNLFFKPPKDEQTTLSLVFSHDSSLSVETARSGEEAGRSSTAHRVHLSELAFYPDPEGTLTAVLQIQGDAPSTWTIIESTANGANTFFHQLWLDAEQGKNDFLPIFFPWYEDPTYTFPMEDREKASFERSFDEEEKLLFEKGVPHERLKWRRWCIRNKCFNSVDFFHQEYPSTPEEAFLKSGASVFDGSAIMELLTKSYPPKKYLLSIMEEE